MTTKQLLQAGGDGTAVPAGYINEISSVGCTAVTASGVNSISVSAIATFSNVSPGIYKLIGNIPMRPGTRPTAGTVGSYLRVSANTAGALEQFDYQFLWGSAAANSDIGAYNATICSVFRLTATDTITVKVGINDYSGGSTGTPTCDAGFSSLGKVTLVRIA